MQLFWQNQPLFNSGSAAVTSETELIAAESGRPLRYRNRIHVHAFLEYNQATGGQAALTAMENTLRSQLANSYGDLVLKQDSGTNSSLALLNSSSLTGVTIDQGPTFDNAYDSEFVNRRTVTFSGFNETLVANSQLAIVSWKETLSFSGTGGPVYGWRPNVSGLPVLQQIYPSSTVRLVQQGRAVGHQNYPRVPLPFFAPPILKPHLNRVVEEAPQRKGPQALALVNYPISWEFNYESSSPLVALPNLPPF